MVFIVQLKRRIYKVNGQLVLSPHLLPLHKENHCVLKSPSQWQISHPALQVKHMLSVKKWCCKGTAVATGTALGRRALPKWMWHQGPHSLQLCLHMRVWSLIKNAPYFPPQRALVFAGERPGAYALNEALVRCYSQPLRWAPRLPASHFHLSYSC